VESQCDISGEYGGWRMTVMPLLYRNSYTQNRVSRSLVVMEKPISIVPFSGFLLQIFLYT